MESKIKWVLFDLYDSLVITYLQRRYIIEKKLAWKAFKEQNIVIDRQRFYEKQLELQEKMHPYNKNAPPRGAIEQCLAKEFGYNISLEKALEIHKKSLEKSYKLIFLVPHAKTVFKWLKKQKIKIAIISNCETKGAYYNLERFGLLELINEIITSEDCQALKSEGGPFKKFLEKHSEILPNQCIMVGDSLYEDVYSQEHGIPAAILETNIINAGAHRRNKLKEKNLFPKYRINSFEDIKEIIKTINKT